MYQFDPTADRRIATLIGGTRVLFDDTPAPMVYTVAGQVSLVAPYGVQGKSFTRIVVEYNGVKSRPMAIPVSILFLLTILVVKVASKRRSKQAAVGDEGE